MPKLAKRGVILGLGWLCFGLGLIGLVLPVLLGLLLLAIGLILLAQESALVRRWTDGLRERHPKFATAFDGAESKARDWWRRRIGKSA